MEKTLNKQVIYKSNFITLEQHRVQLENNKAVNRDVIIHNGASAIMAIEHNKMLFVKQYRKGIEQYTLEIPAGKLDSVTEDVLDAAKRELKEETGYVAKQWQLLTQMAISPAYVSEKIAIFLATDLVNTNQQQLDEDEFVQIVPLTLQEAKQEINNGLICDAKTLYAVLYWELLELKNEIKN